jgi:hypothetical protein
MADLPQVILPFPYEDLPESEIRELARCAANEAAACLLGKPRPTPLRYRK